MKKNCVVVVPAYLPNMTIDEKNSFKQCTEVLGNDYDICIICPGGLDLKEYRGINSNLLVKEYDGKYFTNPYTYSELLMNHTFYQDFENDYEYMLIYQLDAWVFSNDLQKWIDKGFDYIGAPFIVQELYKDKKYVGNGGFSLRKISSMITYTMVLRDFEKKGLGEDVFFSHNFGEMLNIADLGNAAQFALEAAPEIFFNMSKVWPFGCHAYKKYNYNFFREHIKYYDCFDYDNLVTVCIFNNNQDENANRWASIFSGKCPTYIINNEEGLEFNGQKSIDSYNHLISDKSTNWLLTIDGGVTIEDNFVNTLNKAITEAVFSRRMGVYEISCDAGSICEGNDVVINENIHLYNNGSNKARKVLKGEGYFRLVRKDVCMKVFPFLDSEKNKYGWGIEDALCYKAKELGYGTYVDDRLSVHCHPVIKYNLAEADNERTELFSNFEKFGIKTPEIKAPENTKVLLCCIGKNENKYAKEFVEWYKNLHVDKICVYDNNDVDGERFEDSIGEYIDSGFVELIDYRGKKVCQVNAYNECYKKNSQKYDWIMFFDFDEFLSLNTSLGNDVRNYLSLKQFINYDMIHINWTIFGDSGLERYDSRKLTERFDKPIDVNTRIAYDFPENYHIKSIVRGGFSEIFYYQNPHTPLGMQRCCSSIGISCDADSAFVAYNNQYATLNHYSTKTIEEYCNKMNRGFPDQIMKEGMVKELLVTRFFRTNEVTKEKLDIVKEILGIDLYYLLPKDKSNDVKIYSLCYSKKGFDFLDNSVITPLQVGAANGTDVCKLKDNTGDNISANNYFFIENTGTYWIWKNVHGAKYKGQMQYRRPLSGITEDTDFEKIFTDYDVITCEPFYHPDHKVPTEQEKMIISADTVEQGYEFSNCIDDLYILEMVIKMYYPDYAEDYDKYIKNGPNLYYSNGFIMREKDFDNYSEFLFKCLEGYLKMSNITDIKSLVDHVIYNIEVGKYPRYGNKLPSREAIQWQSEIGGFLSERLWTLWVQHNFKDEKIYKLPYIKMEEGMYT